jgi:transcription initiation factor TFIIB
MSATCAGCNSSDDVGIDPQQGKAVCRICGVVQQHRLIDEAYEQSFAKDSSVVGGDSDKRIGGAKECLMEDCGLGTVISTGSAEESQLSKLNIRTTSSGIDRALTRGYQTIDDLCHSLNLHETVSECAKELFKKIEELKIPKERSHDPVIANEPSKEVEINMLRGRSHECVIAAIVFIACRQTSNPRSIKEISSIVNKKENPVRKCFSLIKRFMPAPSSTNSAVEYASLFAAKLAFPEYLRRACKDVAERAIGEGVGGGRSPMTIASASVFIVGALTQDYMKSFRQISVVSLMKESTIRICYKEMYPHRSKLVTKWDESINIDSLPLL